MKVIDISHHQGSYNAQKARAAGVEKSMVRILHGVAGKDDRFDAFAAANRAAGIPYGAYYFANYIHSRYNGCRVEKARELMQSEVGYLLHLLAGSGVTGWVAIDQEEEPNYNRRMNLSREINTQLLNEAAQMIRQAGFEPCLYCSANWVERFVDVDKLEMPIWAAWYYADPSDPDFDGAADLHSLGGHYATLLQDLAAKGKLCGWQFGRIGYGDKYGVASENIDRNVFYSWPESEEPMNFKTVTGKEMVVTANGNPSCEAFGEPDVNAAEHMVLACGTVHKVTGEGPEQKLAGVPGKWWRIEHGGFAAGIAYVWLNSDRGYIRDEPQPEPKPEPKPEPEPQPRPAAKTVTVTLELTGDQLRRLADWMEGEKEHVN